jgi:hypothetical protein
MRIIIFVNSAPRKRAIEIRQDVERLLLRGEPKNVRIASAPRLKPHVTRDRRRANFLSAADIAFHEATDRDVSVQAAIARSDCNHKVTVRNDRRKSSLTEQQRR